MNFGDLGSLTYRQAAVTLLEAGYVHFASGDWSLAFENPRKTHVLKITPFDPAYLVFANLCKENPHRNLPQIQSIILLRRNGFIVQTPKYATRDRADQQGFIDALKSALTEGETADFELDILCRILREGLQQADNLPYFSSMDWNPDNVLFDGETPKFVDAFNIGGSRITERLDRGDAVDLDEQAVADFLTIPFHCPFLSPIDGPLI